MDSGLSNSDVALLAGRDGDMFGTGGGALFWIFALLSLAGGGFGGFMGGGRPDYVTSAELQAGLNNQATQSGIQQILLSSANNNYETAQLVNNQTNQLMQQNNTNLINAIQGFNTLTQTITGQTNSIMGAISQLGYQLDKCCCDIKTQMLQDRLAETQSALGVAQNTISNANQSQYLLGQLGRFVAWTPSGTQAATAAG